MKIGRRLAKLECALPPTPTLERTNEEQRILVYELAQALLRIGKSSSIQERLTEYASRTESEIRRKAAMPMTDIYRGHIQYVEEMWLVSGRTQPFVPPLLGSDYDEWFLPGLAERRLVMRRRPSVIALIGETISSPWAGPEYPASGSDEAQA
jgi:hypothetical protein